MKKCCHFESAVITEKSPQTPKTPWSFMRAPALSGVDCSPGAEKRQARGGQMQTAHQKSDAFRDLTSGKLRVFDILPLEENPQCRRLAVVASRQCGDSRSYVQRTRNELTWYL
jgi:hypothetical protein